MFKAVALLVLPGAAAALGRKETFANHARVFSMVDMQRHPTVGRHFLFKDGELPFRLLACDERHELRIRKAPRRSGLGLVAS